MSKATDRRLSPELIDGLQAKLEAFDRTKPFDVGRYRCAANLVEHCRTILKELSKATDRRLSPETVEEMKALTDLVPKWDDATRLEKSTAVIRTILKELGEIEAESSRRVGPSHDLYALSPVAELELKDLDPVDACVYRENVLCRCWVRLSNGALCPYTPDR